MTVWKGMGDTVQEGSLCSLPVKKGEPAICCNFFNTLPDRYSPQVTRIPFQEESRQGLSLPPQKDLLPAD